MAEPGTPGGGFVGLRALVCILVLTGVAVLALTIDHLRDVGYATSGYIVVDDELMDTTVDQLATVEDMVGALPAYPGTEAGRTTLQRCSTDSGDLFQPSVQRAWASADDISTVALRQTVAADLAAAGWTVHDAAAGTDVQLLTFDASGGWTASGSVSSSYGGLVHLSVRIDGDPPCRLR